VASRTTLPGGDVKIVVLTSTASQWMLGTVEASCRGLIATIVGDDAANVLMGTPGDDVIWAGDGDDVVRAQGGNDTICLGNGDDTAYGGAGDDNISGGPGADTMFGGAQAPLARAFTSTTRSSPPRARIRSSSSRPTFSRQATASKPRNQRSQKVRRSAHWL